MATALLLAMAGALMSAPRASAHSTLVSSKPAADEGLDEAPGQIVLTFSEPVQASTTQVAVTASSGGSAAAGDPVISGPVVTQRLAGNLPNDRYTIAYRVISVDGHPVSDALSFTVDDPASTAAPLPSQSAGGGHETGAAGDAVAQGDTSTFAKVLYVVLPVLILLLVVGVIRTRGSYRQRNPKEVGDGMTSPFVITRGAPPDPEPAEHVHTRPDITRDREP